MCQCNPQIDLGGIGARVRKFLEVSLVIKAEVEYIKLYNFKRWLCVSFRNLVLLVLKQSLLY